MKRNANKKPSNPAQEDKRYFLTEYVGHRIKVLNNEEELKEILESVRLFNARKTSKYLCGNITTEVKDGKIVLTGHYYRKLTDRRTISDLDSETSKLSERELIIKYWNSIRRKERYPDINIAYFENKGIKYIPVLYNEDLSYMEEDYIQKCLRYHADDFDYGFFKSLANEFCFYHIAGPEIEKIYQACDKVEHQGYLGYGPSDLYLSAYNLYKKLLYKRDKKGIKLRDHNGQYIINNRTKRDFGLFIKRYDMLDNKRKSETEYNYEGSKSAEKELDLIKRRIELMEIQQTRAELQEAIEQQRIGQGPKRELK